MAGRLEFAVQFGDAALPSASELAPGRPMRILIVGDLSGRDTRTAAADAGVIGSRPVQRIDIDNFETVLQRLSPRLELQIDAAPVALEFRSLEDFHPDQLFGQVAGFQELAQFRARLKNPATFAEAAAELRHRFGTQRERPAATVPHSAPAPAIENKADLLDSILGQTSSDTSGRSESIEPLQEFIRRTVEPHLVPAAGPEQERLLRIIDEAIGTRMRSILHHPAFQRLEALWRGLDRLVSHLGSSEDVSLHLVDVTREEIDRDLQNAGPRPESSGLYRVLVERGVGTPGGEPWSLVVGDYTFGPTEAEARLLAALGAISARAGGPFLAAADSRVFGGTQAVQTLDPREWPALIAEEGDSWTALRKSPAAESIGLAWPRVLLRLPYGRETDQVERFAFEEITDPMREHEAYLWGNPALACAQLLAQSFNEQGWSMRPGSNLELDGLPAHSYRTEHGEAELKPCAEIFLTQTAAEAILERGVMPLASYRHRDAVRLVRFQSIALPPAPLRGAWQ